jgi:membrane-associated PAP2 superfamily phosphatase
MPLLVSPFWRTHAVLPLAAFAVSFLVLEVFALDPVIARAWYFDVDTAHWLGTGSGDWWARTLLHSGGRWLARAVAAGALVIWAGSFAFAGWRDWRVPAGFVVLSIVCSVAIVGGLKALTNVDCPWDLVGFGGQNPYVPLFADRPDAMPRVACFPGAHASSGFALVCFYFLWRDRSPRRARWALAAGLLVGIAFSIGQEARGAHFLSHDLASAAIVWCIQLALYAGWFTSSSRSSRPCRTTETR